MGQVEEEGGRVWGMGRRGWRRMVRWLRCLMMMGGGGERGPEGGRDRSNSRATGFVASVQDLPTDNPAGGEICGGNGAAPASPKPQPFFPTYPPWTITHGFYTTMGGFAISTLSPLSDTSTSFHPRSHPRTTLTPNGLAFLLTHIPNALPRLTAPEILDKSKADGLKKTLVCLQATWFCVSTVTRLIQHLPISLLELNSVAHALCALVIYACWWDKPLDVGEPTVISAAEGSEGEKVAELAAYMWMISGVGASEYWDGDVAGRLMDEFDAMWMLGPGGDVVGRNRTEDLLFGREEGGRHDGSSPSSDPVPVASIDVEERRRVHANYPRLSRRLTRRDLRLRLRLFLNRLLPRVVHVPAGIGNRKTAISHLSPSTVLRWRLAHDAITRFSLQDDLFQYRATRPEPPFFDSDPLARVCNEIPNHAHILAGREDADFADVWIPAAFAAVLYGGLHLIAWSAPFETRAEKILWRISAMVVCAGPILISPCVGMGSYRWLREGWLSIVTLATRRKHRMGEKEGAKGVILGRMKIMLLIMMAPVLLMSPLIMAMHVFGRVFLVIECFKSIHQLPVGVYTDVNWPAYVPHIA